MRSEVYHATPTVDDLLPLSSWREALVDLRVARTRAEARAQGRAEMTLILDGLRKLEGEVLAWTQAREGFERARCGR